MTLGDNTILSYITMQNNKQAIEFLQWLKNRMKYKHGDSRPDVSSNIDNVIKLLSDPYKIKPNNLMINTICHKVYPLFNFTKDEQSEFDIGYTAKEKNNVRQIAKKTIEEFININVRMHQ